MRIDFNHLINRLYLFIIVPMLLVANAYPLDNKTAKGKAILGEFKINPELPGSLANKEDAPCFGYENITYDSCNGRGKYYSGYGLEVLRSKFLSNYLSSYDLNTSYICFKHHNASRQLKNLLFVWYSKLEIPKKIALYGIQKKNNLESEIFLRTLSINQFDELNGY